jgi:hypothetical protein
MLSVGEGSAGQHTAFRAAFVARNDRVVVQSRSARHQSSSAGRFDSNPRFGD